MKKINFGVSGMQVPAIAVGCMRMRDLPAKEAAGMIDTAVEAGVNFFDHADIYGGGSCEEKFAEAFEQTGLKREDVFLQSKCGIVPGKRYDFSKEHILQSADASLKRLHTDYLDAFLLHRPDALAEPEEVAEAFEQLEAAGKVRYFGVSNHTPMQMELLKKSLKQPLMVNQLQFGAAHASMVRSGIESNMMTEGALNRDGGVLDYCRLHDVTIQTWSPFQYGMFEGVFLGNPKFPELNRTMEEIGKKYGVSSTTIAVAWILRHPANMQMLSGTMNPKRFLEICAAANIRLTRQEWYDIYLAAGNQLP